MIQIVRMKDVRLATLLAMEKLCSRAPIPDESRSRITSLSVALQQQLCRELRLPENHGALSEVPDHTAISMKAEEILDKLARELSAIHA